MRKLLPLVIAVLTGCATPTDQSYQSNAIVADQKTSIAVIVWGEVHDPKEYEFPAGITLNEAIVRAGGFTQYAARTHVRIKRKDGGTFEFNLHPRYLTKENPPLEDRDLVLVPSGAPVL